MSLEMHSGAINMGSGESSLLQLCHRCTILTTMYSTKTGVHAGTMTTSWGWPCPHSQKHRHKHSSNILQGEMLSSCQATPIKSWMLWMLQHTTYSQKTGLFHFHKIGMHFHWAIQHGFNVKPSFPRSRRLGRSANNMDKWLLLSLLCKQRP
ncbi:uncharacterized protein EI90DRAFT_3292310 [Cantharellus anzutake]|uniref:uncharacterized protein n=1 Tax=Cantharellus anzutake TaxID=1750568 RepID=UPI001902EB8B|nr:uncharacterized protein EI90DRAFT_3292310 [Cantharellus anzutake]KAF8323594.1 hypothetical protein EI90DRAFT_3292310 [Cantharellus anzutake]